MGDDAFVVEIGRDGSRVGRCSNGILNWQSGGQPAPSDEQPWASSIKTALVLMGWQRGAVGVMPASNHCLTATISAAKLPRRGRRQALLYRLEEKLPVAADDVLGDFIEVRDRALGVAILREPMLPRLHALESVGVPVSWVCPAALLAAQTVQDDAWDVLLWARADAAELMLRDNGLIAAWHSVHSSEELKVHLRYAMLQLRRPLQLLTRNLPPDWISAVQSENGVKLLGTQAVSIDEAVATGLALLVRRKRSPLVNLAADISRRSPPALRLLRAAAAAVIVLMLSLCVAMLWRAAKYASIADSLERRQQSAFGALFPDQPVPVDIASRLASEERRLRASGGATHLPNRVSSLIVLRELLSAIPAEARYRIVDLRLNEDTLQLDGEAPTHADANAVAIGLRGTAHVQIDAARSEHLSNNTVAFTVIGAVREAAR